MDPPGRREAGPHPGMTGSLLKASPQSDPSKKRCHAECSEAELKRLHYHPASHVSALRLRSASPQNCSSPLSILTHLNKSRFLDYPSSKSYQQLPSTPMTSLQTYPKPSQATALRRCADMYPGAENPVILNSTRASRIESAIVNFTSAANGRNLTREAGR